MKHFFSDNDYKMIQWTEGPYVFRAYALKFIDITNNWHYNRIILSSDFVYRIDKTLTPPLCIFEGLWLKYESNEYAEVTLWCRDNLTNYKVVNGTMLKNRFNGWAYCPIFMMYTIEDAVAFKLRWL